MAPERYLGREVFICHQLKKGDESALKFLYHLHSRRLFIFVSRFINNTIEAEDIVAESFIQLWKHRQEFESLDGVKAFLFVIAKNRSLNYLKKEKRKNSAHNEIQYLWRILHNHVEVTNSEQELVALIYREAENLPYLARKIFVLIYIDGMTIDEIASLLGMPAQNVRNNKSRALELLRNMLAKKTGHAF